MPDIDLGRYELDEDSNGNLVARDPNDNVVAKWDETAGAWDWGQTEHKNIGSLNTDGVTMYVDPTGDDANDGLTADNPKATINAAIADAPIQGNQAERLTIDVSAGTITDANKDYAVVEARDLSVATVEIFGDTDSNGDPNVVLDAGTDAYCVAADGADITLVNVELTNAAVNLRARLNATVDLSNVHITAGDDTRQAWNITHGASMFDDADCLYDVSASTVSTDWVGEVNHGQAKLAGEHIGDWVRVKEGGRAFFTADFSVDAGGSSYGIWVYYGSTAKIDAVTVSNATSGIRVEGGAHYSLSGVPSFSSVTNKWSGGDDAVHNDRDGDTWTWLPRNTGFPDDTDTESPAGMMSYDNDTGHLSYRSTVHPSWMEAGRRRLEEGSGVTIAGGSKVQVENYPANDRLREFDYQITSTSGSDYSLSMTQEDDGSGNPAYYLENTGTDDVTIRYAVWEMDM